MLPECLVCESFFFLFRKKKKEKVALVLAKKRALFNDLKGIFGIPYSHLMHLTQHTALRRCVVFCGRLKSLGFPLKWK